MSAFDTSKTYEFIYSGEKFRADDETHTIRGTAVVFGEVTRDYRSITFAPGSITADNDVALQVMHGGLAFARMSRDTLQLNIDKKRVRYTAQLNPEDPEAMSLFAKVKRGDVTDSSMGVKIENYTIDEATEVVTVNKATLQEISIVGTGAFKGADVSLSALSTDMSALKRRKALAELKLRTLTATKE